MALGPARQEEIQELPDQLWVWAVTVSAPLHAGKREGPPQRKSTQYDCLLVPKCMCSVHLGLGLVYFLLHNAGPLLSWR